MNQVLLAARWYLALQLFGLAALPLALRIFRHLPGRGYAFARPLGLLIGGWAFWLLLTFGWLPNSAGTILFVLIALAATGIALFQLRPTENSAPFSWQHVLITEVLLLVAFIVWCLVRAHMPRIETAGGEKWMEIAFLNAILRAPQFPPHDPWLSGFAISYYYFGYVIVSMLVRLAAVPTTVGFNLVIATLFALACTGAYGVVYTLLAAEKRRSALWSGLLGPLMVTVTANLEGLLEVFHARGLFPAGFWQWLDIRSINVPPPPFAEGSWMPTRYIWWWQASRTLHDYFVWHTPASPAESEVIDEFPAFSFLLGDMHSHLLALPFVLLAIMLGFALIRRKSGTWKLERWNIELPLTPWELITYAICLGGLGFLNTWDFPMYLFVIVVAYAVASFHRPSGPSLYSLGAFALILAAEGVVLYLPFWLGLRSQASGILPNLFNSTRMVHFVTMFGPLLIPLVALVVAEARKRGVKAKNVALFAGSLFLAFVVFLALVGLVSPDGRRYLMTLRAGEAIPGLSTPPDQLADLVGSRLLGRLLSPWTPLAMAAIVISVALTLFKPRAPDAPSSRPTSAAYALILVATAALLIFGVEFVYLRDIFGTRMNTVFKFYFQAWIMWGLVSAYGLARLLDIDPIAKRRWHAAVAPALSVASIVLIAGGLVYLLLAVPTRAREYGGPPTLDGAAHLYRSQPEDFAAIDWLNENVVGVVNIVESTGGSYTYAGRISAFTGLPTVLGWPGHEHQWRGTYEEVGPRENDVDALYASTRADETLTLLDQYDIRYIYVGPTERARYTDAELATFDTILETVYDANGVTIYHYTPEEDGGIAP
jgi:YYY domain-containing protein